MTARPDAGFTLIEALVAMAVLAVAASGFVRATEGHIDTIARLEARATAGWVAENRLVEARVPGLSGVTQTPMLHRDWQATVATHASEDPDIATVAVTATNGGTQTTLRGFADTAPPVPAATTASDGGTSVEAAVAAAVTAAAPAR